MPEDTKAPEPANNEPAPGPDMEEPASPSQAEDKKAPERPRKVPASARQATKDRIEAEVLKADPDQVTLPRNVIEQMEKQNRDLAEKAQRNRVEVDIHQPHRETIVQVFDVAPDGSRVPSTRITLRGASDRIGHAVDAGLQLMLKEVQ